MESVNNRDKQGKFIPGVSGNLEGRPIDTSEQKIIKKATKEIIKKYKKDLTEALPKISPVVIEKAVGGDIQFIKEVHDRVMGKSLQKTDLTSKGEKLELGVVVLPSKEE